jgi:hypothetical protein
VAIKTLRENIKGLSVDAQLEDLEAGRFQIDPGAYDLICDFHYLQRDLFPRIREGISPGGIFAGEIHLADDVPGRTPAFVLQPGELRAEFAGWKILFYSEGSESSRSRPAARIIARKA